LDGVSFVTTGKSTADHAISAIANEDCALLRIVDGKEICDPNGEVLLALIAGDPANEDWNFDPEFGSLQSDAESGDRVASELQAAAEPVEGRQLASAVATEAPQRRNRVAYSTPALTPGPVGQGAPLSPPSDALELATKPLVKSQKPRLPNQEILKLKLPEQSARQVTRVIQNSGQITTYSVIGSFQNADNARRVGKAQGNEDLIQTVEVNGTTTHRVLLDRPVEQARREGFPDAWPVRLCAGDLNQPPCGHLVVSNGGVYVEMASK
jgi:hypothetical protein